MKRILSMMMVLSVMLFAYSLVSGQTTDVTAEAISIANLRSTPSIEGEVVGEIQNGTRYPVIGRSEFFPWVLLGDPGSLMPIGWVFDEVVTITGNLNTVPLSSVEVVPGQMTAPTSAPDDPAAPTPDTGAPPLIQPPSGEPTATLMLGLEVTPMGDAPAGEEPVEPAATLTPTPIQGIVGIAIGEINVRYGPGVDYQPLRRVQAGTSFEVTGYHTQFPWLQVRFEDSPNGFAWIAQDLLDVQGNVFETRAISTIAFDLPTLTPTPAMRASSSLPGVDSVPISDEFAALGDMLWDYVLSRGFVLESRRFGSLYLQDLQTGEAITYGNEYAFSGTSINKIAILLAYFGTRDGTLDLAEARDVANTMICSENVATNRLLEAIGGGDALTGAEETTRLLRQLGLRNTFLTAPYDTTTPLATSTPMPQGRIVEIPQTEADQIKSNPNPTNQMTVEEMGWLLSNIYQCAYNETGPLIDDFDGLFTPQECRKMLYVMGENTVDGLLKAGAPEGIRVSHKHGWVQDTHGNAAIFFTPGGDYVMVMMLHEPQFLNFVFDSLPTLAHTSMRVFNSYNPGLGLDEPREGYIPTPDECNYTTNDPIVQNLASSSFLFNNDVNLFYNAVTAVDPAGPTATPTLRPTWTPEGFTAPPEDTAEEDE